MAAARRGRRRRRLALLATAGAALTLAGLAAAFVYTDGRLGCPSQRELERPRSAEEVVSAFADVGVALTRTSLPRGFPRRGEYLHAVAYWYVPTPAALFVLVCETRCVNAPEGHLRLRKERIPVGPRSRQHIRQFSTLGNNIAVFMTDNDRRSGRELQARVQPVLNELDAAEDPDSRCYIH